MPDASLPSAARLARYLMMWKTARINYIRQRLRGEWFPPPEAAPSDRRGLIGPPQAELLTHTMQHLSVRCQYGDVTDDEPAAASCLCLFVTRWLLHPNGFVRRSFDSILMIFVLYNAIEVPFFVG